MFRHVFHSSRLAFVPSFVSENKYQNLSSSRWDFLSFRAWDNWPENVINFKLSKIVNISPYVANCWRPETFLQHNERRLENNFQTPVNV